MFKLLFSFSFFINLLAYSQTLSDTKLKGIILDSLTQKPIYLATVRLKENWNTMHSNIKGYFEMRDLSNNEFDTLIIRATGYFPTYIIVKKQEIEANKIIFLKSFIPNITADERSKNMQSAKGIINKVITNIPKNYLTESYSYKAYFQQNVHDMDVNTVYETNNAVLNIRDKGLKKDNINTKISLEYLHKSELPEFTELRKYMIGLGGNYNYFYKLADCDFVRAFHSKNEYSKWTHDFFRENTKFDEYDMFIENETNDCYSILLVLKENFSYSTIGEKVKKLDEQQLDKDLKYVTSMNMRQKEIESVRFKVLKSNYGILKIDFQNHLESFSFGIRSNCEVGYKFDGSKFYFDYAKLWTPLGKILSGRKIYVYSELKITNYLTQQEQKSIEKKAIDRNIEIYNIPDVDDSSMKNTFKPLKPFF